MTPNSKTRQTNKETSQSSEWIQMSKMFSGRDLNNTVETPPPTPSPGHIQLMKSYEFYVLSLCQSQSTPDQTKDKDWSQTATGRSLYPDYPPLTFCSSRNTPGFGWTSAESLGNIRVTQQFLIQLYLHSAIVSLSQTDGTWTHHVWVWSETCFLLSSSADV